MRGGEKIMGGEAGRKAKGEAAEEGDRRRVVRGTDVDLT